MSEHPENLGRVGAWGSDSFPASIWDCDEAHSLVADCGWSTLALHQQNFGAPTAKPTRILYNNKVFDNLGHLGWPTFDHGGRYTGPLPKPGPSTGRSLMRQPGDTGVFRTAASSTYPSGLC